MFKFLINTQTSIEDVITFSCKYLRGIITFVQVIRETGISAGFSWIKWFAIH